MKRILAISLSLAMVFALFGAITVSVSAEDVEWSVFKSADNGDMPTKGATSSKAAAASITNTYSTISSLKIWKYYTDGNASAMYFTCSAGDLADVKNIRLWAAGDNGGFDLILETSDNVIYGYNKTLISEGELCTFGSLAFTVYNTGYVSYGAYTSLSSKKVAFSDIDMSKVTKIQIQRRRDATVGSKVAANAYFDKIEIAKPAAAPSDPTIEMASGAAMRIDGDTDGIRFTATVDKTAFDALVSENATVNEIGTLIAKAGTDISKVVVENAVDTSTGAMELADGKIPVAKYAAGTTMQDVAGTDKYVIYGSLVEIKDINANQQYVARAYVKYTDSTGSHVLYASALSEARSIAQVAKAIVDANDSYYTSLCKDHKAVVNYWADQYVAA